MILGSTNFYSIKKLMQNRQAYIINLLEIFFANKMVHVSKSMQTSKSNFHYTRDITLKRVMTGGPSPRIRVWATQL